MKRLCLLILAMLIALSSASCSLEGLLHGDRMETTATVTDTQEAIEDTAETAREQETTSSSKNPGEPQYPFMMRDAQMLIGAEATYFTVGEDQYDLDCHAYLLKNASYEKYCKLVSDLEARMMDKYCDNGENGIEGECYQTTLHDRSYLVNVTYYAHTEELYMTVEKYRAPSPYQINPEDAAVGTETSFHMPEMPTVNGSYKFGECEIFRLSNGHFVIVDGAQEFSAEPTVAYLENLTPDGEIPVVDAWFLTHAHPDHAYCVWGIGRDPSLVSRIRVEGFYYTWPDDDGMRMENDYEDLMEQVANVKGAMKKFVNTEGEVTPQYKLHGGMRFYFGELEVQVLFTQDQIRPSEYGNGFNDTSSSFKFTVHMQEGRDVSFLVMGDASSAICKKLMKHYTAETLHTEFFQSLHHGNNDCKEFFEYIQPDYLNYTHKSDERGKNKEGYRYLASICKGVNCSPTVIELKNFR